MLTVLAALALLGAAGIIATIAALRNDGYRRLPTRADRAKPDRPATDQTEIAANASS